MNLKLSPRLRALSLLLALTLILGLLPGSVFAAEAETAGHWADSYLSQMVEWGFIRADQAQEPDRKLTRADFMSIVNRAYGYHEMGPTPFEDVSEFDWYYDDVGIAYNAGYINGTSPTTASPEDELNRETAATILGRNMMLQESAGELLDFSDARDISNWARGTIKSSMEHYLVNGYDDGTFRPQRAMSWGEIAALVTRTIGTPLQDEGDYSLGGVFGNVTITSPGVTLRDTVISGDLYITGGVGLGGIKLENVTVLGRIIASGTGTSEGGASILLRNVSADELLVDSLRDNEVSIQADGITEIGKTTVRTSAYIEDNTPEGLGLHTISLEGDSFGEGEEIPEGWMPPRLTLAGRIEEVINLTPNSTVQAAKGTVARLTVDETAVDSRVVIDRGAVVRNLILDSGINVSGEGDITRLEVNAPGSNVEMLPDQIVIRPGTTSVIAGHEMDSAAAEEFLLDPMILAGYPMAQDITPTSIEAVFAGNKQGRIYWAVSTMENGSIGADDLLKPPSYNNKAVRWGTADLPRGNEEVTSRITGLASTGEYYLSAILEDAKGKLSPVKVISFTTPDNTVPAFCTGYPHMSSVSPRSSVVVVMPTKNCSVYYALMPQSATAPTVDELKACAVAGSLGVGMQNVYKNQESTIIVNDTTLTEKTTYVLYLLLSDGVNNSAIVPLTFTTTDETPPVFIVDPTVTDVKATSVSMTFQLNEDGIVYWVAVPAGTVYPKPEPGTNYDTAPLNTDYAKLQVMSGMNIGPNGKAGRVNAKAFTDGTITVSGLQAETAYDFYYVAVDTAGNRSERVGTITINTLDTTGPKFTQSFSHVSGTDKTKDPLSDTAIYLDVSENIRYDGEGGGKSFLELYQETQSGTQTERNVAINQLASCLYNSIRLHKVSAQDSSEETIIYKYQLSDTRNEWAIDYTQARVTSLSPTGIRIEFPTTALHLENGGTYYFTIEKIRDVSNNQNPIVPEMVDFYRNQAASLAGGHSVPVFEVGMPRVDFSSPGVSNGPVKDGESVRMDMSFRMQPVSTETVGDSISYDVILWTGNQLRFDLYYRVVDELGRQISDSTGRYPDPYTYTNPNNSSDTDQITNYLLPRYSNNGTSPDTNGWIYLGNSGDLNPTSGQESGRSVNKNFNGCSSTTFPLLKNLSSKLRYEFVIHLTQLGNIPETQNGRETWRNWNGNVVFHVDVAAGQSNNLNGIASDGTPTNPGGVTQTRWREALAKKLNGGAIQIGRWYNADNQELKTMELSYRFTDSRLPSLTSVNFKDTKPTSTTVQFTMSTAGMIYWMVGLADSGTNDHTPEIITTRTLLKSGEASIDQNEATTNAEESGALLALSGLNDEYHIRLTDKVDGTGKSLAPPSPAKGDSMPAWMYGTTNNPPEKNEVDDPETPNLIQRPNKNWVMNPGSDTSTANSIHGSVVAKGSLQENFNIEGLLPESTYYLYMVIKGESDTLSHVYLYQFTTPKTVKPKLQLGWREPNATISAEREQAGLISNVSYVVFTLSDAKKISKLSQPLEIGTEYGIRDANGNLTLPSIYSTSSLWNDGRPYTVLDALVDKYRNNAITNSDERANAVLPPSNFDNYSVFDIFASTRQKSELSDFLRGGFQTEFLGAGVDYVDFSGSPVQVTSGRTRSEPLEIEAEGTEHVILGVAWADGAAGRNEEIDSYAAYPRIHIGTATYPAIDTVNWDARITGGTYEDLLYPGRVTFSFTQPMYTASGDPLDNVNIFDCGIWSSGTDVEGKNVLKERVQANVQTDRMTTTVTLTARNGGGWADGDHIQVNGGQWVNEHDMPCQQIFTIDVIKTTTGVSFVLKYGSTSKTFTYKFPEDEDLQVYIDVQTANGMTLEEGSSDEAPKTLYIDNIETTNTGTKGELRLIGSIIPRNYMNMEGNFVWLSSNKNVLDVKQTNDDGSAIFEIKGTGQTTIRLSVTKVLPSGGRKSGEQTMTVYVGNTITFSSVSGTGAKKEGNTVTINITPNNSNPIITFVFTSVSPLPSSVVTNHEAYFTPDHVFGAPSEYEVTLSPNGKTLTVRAQLKKMPTETTGQTKLIVDANGAYCEVIVNITGKQSTLTIPIT